MEMYDLKLEASILGMFLDINSESWSAKVPFLKAHHFFNEQNREIFLAMQDLMGKRKLSAFNLGKLFPAEQNYITSLSQCKRPWSFVADVRSLIELSKRRELCALADMIRGEAESFQDNRNINEALVKINSHFEDSFKRDFEINIQTSKQISEAIAASLNAKHDIYSTGLKYLDSAMGGGLYAGKSYAIAARKKTGKTVIASTISSNLNFSGVKHLFIAAEMTPTEIHQRNIARDINRNSLAFIGEERSTVPFQEEVVDYYRRDPGNIFYLGSPGISFNELRMSVSAAILKHGIKGVILDYFQLVSGKDNRESQASHYDTVAQWIANFCRQNNIWSLVTAQMNQDDNIRGGEGIRLAFDQVYELKKSDKWQFGYYLDQMDTRYTPWCSVGDNDDPRLSLERNGPYFADRN